MSKCIRQLIRHKMPLELAEFLRENKCTEKFINNLYTEKTKIASSIYKKKSKGYYDYLKSLIYSTFYNEYKKIYITIYSIPVILERSFSFIATPEGYAYWLKLYCKAFNYQENYR